MESVFFKLIKKLRKKANRGRLDPDRRVENRVTENVRPGDKDYSDSATDIGLSPASRDWKKGQKWTFPKSLQRQQEMRNNLTLDLLTLRLDFSPPEPGEGRGGKGMRLFQTTDIVILSYVGSRRIIQRNLLYFPAAVQLQEIVFSLYFGTDEF